MKYQVMWVEERTTSGGKQMKSLTLQGEGKQYPDKFVACWSDHPLFATIAAGQTIEGEIESKDSSKPNPHGGFYKNKVLLKPGQSPAPVVPPQSTESAARTYNYLQFEVVPRLDRILAWQDRRDVLDGVEAPKKVEKEWDGVMPFEEDPTNSSPF